MGDRHVGGSRKDRQEKTRGSTHKHFFFPIEFITIFFQWLLEQLEETDAQMIPTDNPVIFTILSITKECKE